MALTLASAAALLKEHHLLREIIQGDMWTMNPSRLTDIAFRNATYDTRQITPGTLLFCKGRFKPEYLNGADAAGLAAYVAETDFSNVTAAPGLIVNDVRQAMSLLSAAFFGRPQDKLTVIGITGTKGKTTTAYFVKAMIDEATGNRCALFSSVDNCLDGHTFVESDLTTPESLDAFRMMREAVNNGMTHLVMEVSSQAYKVERVYGLTFDAGAFLNISPDHISAIEHPTFEDYLYCKRQITANSRVLVMASDIDHADLIREDADAAGINIATFAVRTAEASTTDAVDDVPVADITATAIDAASSTYEFHAGSHALGRCRLSLEGSFNAANAAAAITLVRAVGIDIDAAVLESLEHVRIAGRMEHYEVGNITVYVDYAHNYVSTKTLTDFIARKYAGRNPYVIAVTGSVGDKAVDRREGIIKGLQDGVDRIILTSEDTVKERMIDILHDMQGYLTRPQVVCDIELDRAAAIEKAIDDARSHADRLAVVLVIGKGEERWIKVDGKHAPYEGDDHIVTRLLGIA